MMFAVSLHDSLKAKSQTYFYSGFVAYCLGLAVTILVMHYFKHAQVSYNISVYVHRCVVSVCLAGVHIDVCRCICMGV